MNFQNIINQLFTKLFKIKLLKFNNYMLFIIFRFSKLQIYFCTIN